MFTKWMEIYTEALHYSWNVVTGLYKHKSLSTGIGLIIFYAIKTVYALQCLLKSK